MHVWWRRRWRQVKLRSPAIFRMMSGSLLANDPFQSVHHLAKPHLPTSPVLSPDSLTCPRLQSSPRAPSPAHISSPLTVLPHLPMSPVLSLGSLGISASRRPLCPCVPSQPFLAAPAQAWGLCITASGASLCAWGGVEDSRALGAFLKALPQIRLIIYLCVRISKYQAELRAFLSIRIQIW
jgi:hypothetical protein